jgi:hypothetical protein
VRIGRKFIAVISMIMVDIKKINIDKPDSNTTIHAMYSCTSMVSYGIRPYHLSYCQLITQIPDGMGAGAIIWHHTTVDVWHGVQPYF